MKNHLLIKPALLSTALILASSISLAQPNADNSYNQLEADKAREKMETKGILGGAVIGAIIGGPPGAIIAAAIGGLMGNNSHTQEENGNLLSSLNESQNQLLALQDEQRELQVQYELALEVQQNANFLSASLAEDRSAIDCCNDSTLAIHFKTNSTTVENHYRQQLQALSDLANNTPDTVIEITGFADSRGEVDENYVLSQDRVKSVQELLISMGSEGENIQANAYGESQSLNTEESLEGYFFDRRVNIRVHNSNHELITQSQ